MKFSLVFKRNGVAVSVVKHELEKVDLGLQNMSNMARGGGRHLQSFQEKVGDGVVFQEVNLKRAEIDTEIFAGNREDILSDSRRFCSKGLRVSALLF